MQQLPLPFEQGVEKPPTTRASANQPLILSSSFASAARAHHAYLSTSQVSLNTTRNFVCDIAMLERFVGSAMPISRVSPADLARWVIYLEQSEHKFSAKTISRRVAAVRHFFAWLAGNGVLPTNPAADIPCRRVNPPLPLILTAEECQQLLELAATNPRTHLIVTLLLNTGIKKGEMLKLRLAHFEFSGTQEPAVWILHETAKNKDRKLRLPAAIGPILEKYCLSYAVEDRLFACTDRNIEYILKNLERKLGIGKRITAQILRDTYAAQQIRQGVTIEEVMKSLGLAPIEWNQDIRDKYLKLAASPS